KDKATNKVQSVRIEASTQLSKEEVEKLKTEAMAHAEEDKKKKELVEARNLAEQAVYLAEKSLRDGGDKISPEIKSGVEQKIADLKSIKDGGDLEAIKSKTAELSSELQKIGQQMYGKSGEENPPAEGGKS
ncbi:Hsp70 family protein, partial [Candidatus Wolfebacteria bacterium]|nr:Hsp70 family protein [Candidatus Wolfebacteria bacterium]